MNFDDNKLLYLSNVNDSRREERILIEQSFEY